MHSFQKIYFEVVQKDSTLRAVKIELLDGAERMQAETTNLALP